MQTAKDSAVASPNRSTWTLRKVLLQVHLYLGLVAAIFLFVLGITGSIMAFEIELGRIGDGVVWSAHKGPVKLSQQELIKRVETKYAPTRVNAIQIFRGDDIVEQMSMSDRSRVMIDPYDGTITGRLTGPTKMQKWLSQVHQLHLKFAPNPGETPRWAKIGKMLVNYAGLVLFLLIPTGIILWWRTKRASIKFGASWFRVFFDAHHAMGIYAALFLFLASLTGMFIGFDWGEEIILSLTHSERPGRVPPVLSKPAPGGSRITVDQAIEKGQAAIPEASVAGIQIPANGKGTYNVVMRVPEETTESVHSNVWVDQFSGEVLKVINFRTNSLGYRVIRFNRGLHTGDVLGTPTHILMSLSSLVLSLMVITGLVIWIKKLAI